MKIYTIQIKNDGYVHCESCFYSAEDGLSTMHPGYTFSSGINMLTGEIDSGNWSVSYLLSMYKHRPKDFILFGEPTAVVNDEVVSLDQLSEYSCYMDETLYPLFRGKATVKERIRRGLAHSKRNDTYDDIKNIFDLDSQRVERPPSCVGNERFRAMAAIGLSYQKEIFCFPWLSHERFVGYHANMTGLLRILEQLGEMAIVPVGAAMPQNF